VKELLKSDSICESCAQMTMGPIFLTHSPVYDLLVKNMFFFAVSYEALILVTHTK